MAKTAGGGRNKTSSRINSSKVMTMAHKLYRLYGGTMSFSESIKQSWKSYGYGSGAVTTDYKAGANKSYLDKIKKAYKDLKPAQRSSYDDLSIPESAFYTSNKRGRFGSKFVGD